MGARVLCAVAGCDHRTCHAGPFQVVFVGLDHCHEDGCVARACVSRPVTGNHSKPGLQSPFVKWSKRCSALHLDSGLYIYDAPSVFVQDTLHFKLCNRAEDRVVGILKYDMSTNSLSLIDMPLAWSVNANASILVAMEDDSLGFAHVDGLILNLWSRHMGSDGVASWTQRAVIDIKGILPIGNPNKRLRLIGSVEGTDIIFVTTDLGIYKINLKSLQWKKVWERKKFQDFIPYMIFYNPQGLRNDGDKKNLLEGSSAEVRAHDAASVVPIGQLPRITQAGEDDLESESYEDLESESYEYLEYESYEDRESESEEDLESESEED
ncbi:uncharacterized protein LOC125530410 [Triticum urartu]|uniref:uncharacterized protein LOC125530410 n=1 Tax=Triticum urartu TaxID=4572 RepID=UPI0020440DD6|nr:uncharacterized protein LOC125530410 [Triticum urartu]